MIFKIFQINSVTRMADKFSVSAEINIMINATDNEAVYKCEATNPALDIPLFETIRFNVYCKRNLNFIIFEFYYFSYHHHHILRVHLVYVSMCD